jgi:hypothetical protein
MGNDIDKCFADMFVLVYEMHCQVQGECGWVKNVGRSLGVDVDCVLHYASDKSWIGHTGIGSYYRSIVGFGVALFDQTFEHDYH